MTKAELIERIIDTFNDMSGECPTDYLGMDSLTLEEATMYLAERRADERSADLTPDECLPDEVTPELFMEAENCYIRMMKFEARVQRLAEWITDNDCTCEYANYYYPVHDDAIDIVPVDYIWEKFPFKMKDDMLPNPLVLIELGQRSPEFSPNHEYCWYDKEKNQLYSCNEPFRDGVLDANAFARFILLDAEAFGYMFDDIIPEDEIPYILGCTKEEYINE